jgi:predicted permease
MWSSSFLIEGAKEETGGYLGNHRDSADLADVGSQFFSVMSIPILAGRAFTAQDTETSPPVSVINETLARKFFPNANPIGKRFRVSTEGPAASRWLEIIGICADTRYHDMREPPPPLHFDLYRQMPEIDGVTFIIRSSLPPSSLIPSLRRAAQQIDPDLPLTTIRTQQQQIDASMQQERMFASLTAGFGILALALACVGIYGIMAYTVSQRTNEIGIRLALGAARAQIRTMVLREAGWLAAAGVVVGLGVTLALIHLVKSMLYGLKPTDPIPIGSSVLLLLLVAIIAGWIPAQRASKVEPIDALRQD